MAKIKQNQTFAQIYDVWETYLYEIAERIDIDISERDYCFMAEAFLEDYDIPTRTYCWNRMVIEREAEIASGFDGCLEFPIPSSFYEYAPKQLAYVKNLVQLDSETKEINLTYSDSSNDAV